MIRGLFPHPLYTVFLALGWMILNERYSVVEFFIGYALGAAIVRALGKFWPSPIRLHRPARLARLALTFATDILVANFIVAWTVIRPRLDIEPAFVVIPLDLEDDFRITLLANMISLTPGTLSVDVAPDRSALYVHCLSAADSDAVRRSIKERFESAIKESIS